MKKVVVLWLLLFAIVGVAMAASENDFERETFGKDVRQAVMQMHAAQLECRVDYLISMLGYSEEYTGNSYEEMKLTLESSIEDVKEAADKNDLSAFVEAVSKTKSYSRAVIKTIRDAWAEAIQNYNGSDRREFITQMRDDFDSARKDFTECHLSATKQRISAEVSMNKYWIGQGEDASQRMKENNYNTDQLDEILNEADENTKEMENIAEEENDVEKLLEERKTHWEHHLWLWAQYHKERLNLFLDRIEKTTDGYEGQIEEIRGILEEAASIGDDEYYGLGEYKKAMVLLKSATQRISNLISQIQGAEANEGEEG